jgi:tight adherence protein C
MSEAMTGAAIGLMGGTGLALVLARLPLGRRPTLTDRVAPYLGGAVAGPSHKPSLGTEGGRHRIVLSRVASGLDRMLGGDVSVRRRLARAGRDESVERFRLEQTAWGAAGLAAALCLSLLLVAAADVRAPAGLAMLCALGTVAGVLCRDFALTSEVKRREARMLAEFPTLAELLALAVSAGEGPAGALERVTSVGHGELARELGRALAEARAGASLTDALSAVASRTGLPALTRFMDGVAVAVERGTPLADVLRAQATDAREAGRRALIESGGRKEIAMMLPVVFLILPVTVLFALYPGMFALHLYAP